MKKIFLRINFLRILRISGLREYKNVLIMWARNIYFERTQETHLDYSYKFFWVRFSILRKQKKRNLEKKSKNVSKDFNFT